LVLQRITAIEDEAARAEDRADALARERDVLASRKTAISEGQLKAKLRARDGVAVLPYKGPNGTWKRPIPIECHDGMATHHPNGPGLDFSALTANINPRLHPLVTAVARMMVRSQNVPTPDGQPSVPYILFIVRPSGIKPYYAALALLETLGIAHGYELVEADL